MTDECAKEDSSLNPISCPICLQETTEDLVHGPCHHEFCRPCVERLLLAPPVVTTSITTNYVTTPTLGLCPICRQELYLFDLVYSESGVKVYPTITRPTVQLPTELTGAIFVECTENYPGVIGRGSYHFPEVTDDENDDNNGHDDDDDNDKGTSNNKKPKGPYYDISKTPQRSDRTANNSSSSSSKIIPFIDCHWHDASRTFAGLLQFPRQQIHPQSEQLFSHHQVIFSFSADWRFVRQGVVILRRRPKESYATIKEIQLDYPFDGTWKCVHSIGAIVSDLFPVDKVFTIQGFVILESMTSYPCMIRPQDKQDSSSRPKLVFLATMMEFVSVVVSTDLDLQTQTIPIGYEWTWIDPVDTQIRMTWKRLSISSCIPPDQVTPVGGSSGRLLIRSTENEQDTYLASLRQHRAVEPQYNPNSLWGNVFCQGLQVGLASYHFEGPGGDVVVDTEEVDSNGSSNNNINYHAYISYESPSTGIWPPLDNGQSIPAQVPFRNISFDAESRTFRGHICWQEDYGTSWQGVIRWEYEMVFDQSYTCIISGQVMSIDTNHTEECLSRFGESLIYCNAKLWHVFRNEGTTTTQTATGLIVPMTREHFHARSDQLRQELQSQGASVRTVALVHRILTAALDPQGENPIEYLR